MSKKILLIEDNEELCVAMKMLLTMNGYITEVSKKSKQALEVIETFLPNIIIMDYDHHSKDDRIFCSQLGTSEMPHYIPVLLLTSSEGILDYIRHGYKNYKAIDHLDKPFEMITLQVKLLKHLRKYHPAKYSNH
jgi:DNA-binding response OmpR family regulator